MDFNNLELELLNYLEENTYIDPNNRDYDEFNLNISKLMIPLIVKSIEMYHKKLNE